MKLITICFLLFFYSSVAQTDSTIYFKELGWTIILPSDFKIMDSTARDANIKLGKKMLEDETGKQISMSNVVHLISASKDKMTSFVANYTKSKKITSENWQKYDSGVKIILVEAISKQIPIKPDTSYSSVSYDGVTFKKIEASFILSPKVTFHFSVLTTYYIECYLKISYNDVDPETGNELLNILNTSKFEKH